MDRRLSLNDLLVVELDHPHERKAQFHAIVLRRIVESALEYRQHPAIGDLWNGLAPSFKLLAQALQFHPGAHRAETAHHQATRAAETPHDAPIAVPERLNDDWVFVHDIAARSKSASASRSGAVRNQVPATSSSTIRAIRSSCVLSIGAVPASGCRCWVIRFGR